MEINDSTPVFYQPKRAGIIDYGITRNGVLTGAYSGETLEQMRARYPDVIIGELGPVSSASEEMFRIQPVEISAERWMEMLESKHQILPESIAIGYLVSTITALCSGSMVLLNGTVGVGKSSIVSKSAELLGGNSEIIPIRPSWLDPSDLLGFFDPLSETFRPSSFTTALKTAAKYPDRPFFICLDELNLAKIENYGADLLSTLEYSKNQAEAEGKKRNLSLYSQDIERHLW